MLDLLIDLALVGMGLVGMGLAVIVVLMSLAVANFLTLHWSVK